jgi:hypothetical protein
MTPAGLLTDPRVRLGAGTAALLVTAMAARRNRVGPGEAAAFRAVNELPGWLYPPAWIVMQLGALGAAPAAAGAAWLAGDRELAGRLLAGGAALGLIIDAALTLAARGGKEKIEPKGLCYRDLGPWPVPAGAGQRRIEHPIKCLRSTR